MGQFAEIAEKFRAYHTNSLNVALHMVTTPMGIVAALIALRQNLAETEYAYEALVGAYVVSLLFTLKNVGLWFATAAWMGGLVVVADQLAPAFDAYATLKLLAAGYVGQELAHLITNEKTFQSSYQFKSLGWPALLLEHTYYLLPLCLDALVHMRESFAVVDRGAQLRRALQADEQGGSRGAQDGVRLRHRGGPRAGPDRALVVPASRG